MDTTSSSSSEEELSSSECELDESSCDPEDDDEKLETAKICGATLQLPQLLCESKDIFQEFFSLKTFNSLSEINKQHLKNFLPSFPENDEQEKNTTLQNLFNRETFRFNSPLSQFHDKLKAGHFRPDIARMRKLLKQEQRKEYKFQQKVYCKKILRDLMVSRQRLLDVANNLPPGIDPKMDKNERNLGDDTSPRAFRAKRRYFQELAQIKSQVNDTMDWSEDENYPEGPPMRLSKKLRRHLNGLQNSGSFQNIPNSEKTVISTLATKSSGLDLENSVTSTYNPYQLNEDSYRALLFAHKKRKHSFDSNPELVTKGINVREIAQRTQLTPSKKPTTTTTTATTTTTTTSTATATLLSSFSNKPSIDASKIKKKKLHLEQKIHSNSDGDISDSDEYIDPVVRSPTPIKNKSPRNNRLKQPPSTSPKIKPIKQAIPEQLKDFETKVVKNEPQEKPLDLKEPEEDHPQISLNDNLISPMMSNRGRIIPASLSDLDGIDMMSLPVDLEDSNIDILDDIEAIESQEHLIETNIKHELLMQETHSNFLSLIRDIICSTIEHRMSLSDIEERLKGWQTNPISPLNTWYSLVDNWLSLLPSAISFLTGEMCENPEDYVPYLEFKPNLHLYQWIGAGRDSDNRLNALCQFWLEHRDDNIQNLISVSTPVKKVVINSTPEEMQIVKPATPPPPRYPTNWVVRKAELQEIEEFREQERQRYANPHKSFTYKMNGYESIVGPVKGMYNQTSGLSKARGHSMLNADRPNFVTILTLVRDAVARLPNGEGTRADICELLKSSQYISNCAPENVLQSVVSGALDRLHTEYDPSVKYDTKKKIWIYLHRSRTEADFERIHQQFQGLSKQFKKSSRKNKTPKQPKTQIVTPTKQIIKSNENPTPLETPVEASTPTTTISTSITTTSATISNEKQFKTPPINVNNRLFNPQTNIHVPAVVTPIPQPPILNLNQNPISTQLPSSLPIQSPKVAGTSLLVTSNKQHNSPKHSTIKSPEKEPDIKQPERQIKIITSSTIAPTEQDIEKAIQTLTPIRVASPINTNKSLPGVKTQKSLVKIINNPQGKSLISPITSTGNNQTVFIKQIDSKTTIAGKNIISQPQITQQLLHTIAAQQKLKNSSSTASASSQQLKQPIIVTTQQLVKSDGQKTIQTIANAQLLQQQQQQTNISQQLIQAINQQQKQTINVNSQQQILQTIKQKVQNQQSVLTLQQAINKQANIQQIQKQMQQQQQQTQLNKGTSLLGQQRIITQNKSVTGAQNQTPLVAKVLTNAAGQVISVESLLAHQKQHGTLPQGTTLRVSGAKPGQTNLIQLSGTSANQIQQFAVVSQNSLGGNRINTQTITSASNMAVNSSTSVAPSQKSLPTKTLVTKPGKFVSNATASNKLTHQLVNAKFVTQNTNKLIPQQKIVQVNQPMKINASVKQQTTPSVVGKLTNTATQQTQQSNVRMVNTAGLNLASFAGKPILLASKGNTIQNLQTLGQNVILQAQSSNSIVLPNNARVITQNVQAQTSQNAATGVVLGAAQLNQIKVQNLVQSNSNQQIVLTGQNIKTAATATQQSGQTNATQTVMLGGAIKMAGTNNRVVLASQGSSGQIVTQQILLPSNFQGGAINIKTLQGLKVIPLAQTTQQTKGRPQVFARIMNPQNARIATQVASLQNSADSTNQSNMNSNNSNNVE